MKVINVAIDGPAGAGKSTIAKLVAKKLNFLYIDTGAMYRAVTYKALKLNIDLDDESQYDFLDDTRIVLTSDDRVLIDGEDVTTIIREQEVTQNVSRVAALGRVREKLVNMQREMAKANNVIMDGRDIGTNVLKDADVKIFLTASVEERAKRRYLELQQRNGETAIDEAALERIKADIIRRDQIDSSRELNPLKKADDAVEIDTSNKTIDEVVDEITSLILGRVNTSMTNELLDNYMIRNYRKGQIIEGEVVAVTDNEVSVDFGYYTEGTIPLHNLTLQEISSARDFVQLGDRIQAVISQIQEDQILLTRIPLELEANVKELQDQYKTNPYITVRVTASDDRVLHIRYKGIQGILPKSEVDVDDSFDPETLIGKEIEVKILELKRQKRQNRVRFVVSRKAIQREKMHAERLKRYEAIELGAVYEGEVVRLEDYGALVIAQGYQGLVPYREISHLPFNHVSEVLQVGQKVNVKVIEKDDKKLHVLYSIKALLPKPWEVAAQNIKPGDVIEGTVARIVDFGAFITVAPLVDGLLHVNEYSHNPFIKLHDELKEGQTIQVKVLDIDANRERLGLSVKALKPNPWTTSGIKRFDIMKGKVVGFRDGDVIVEVAEDVWGILPKNQISRSRRITDASEVLHVEDEVNVKVIEFDPRRKHLMVSIRRIEEDQERAEVRKFLQQQSEMDRTTLGDLIGDKLQEVKEELEESK